MNWKDAYLESRVLSADPLELVRILFQCALDSIHDARQHLANGEIAARSQSISKCSAILAELAGSLNHAAGGSVSRSLAELYRYMSARLIEANLRQNDEILAEVQSLLATLVEAWNGIQLQSATVAKGEPEHVKEPWGAATGPFACEGDVECAHSWSV